MHFLNTAHKWFATSLLLIGLSTQATPNTTAADLALGQLVRANTETITLCPFTELGEACLMNHKQAAEYCDSKNAHLPTSREQASFAIAFGAKGILEVSEVAKLPNAQAPEGYYFVAAINPGNIRDDFYFSHEGYSAEEGGIIGERLWTASIVPTHPDYAHVFYGDWGGGGGKREEHHRDYLNAVRCMPNL